MIEIGDPTEEPIDAASTPKVVIEYHERGGVPWMLIPPLLVLSAVGAILVYVRMVPHSNFRQPPLASARSPEVSGPLVGESVAPVLTESTPPELALTLTEPLATPSGSGERSEPSAAAVADAPPPVVVAPPSPADPDGLPSIPESPAAGPVKAAEPAPPPKLQALGFDPKALEADRKAEAPADPALNPVAREDRPAEREQPREIDPDLLPPDPREARARQELRKLEIFKRVEDERPLFHAELKALCRKFRERSGPEILEMRKKFDLKIDPKAEEVAKDLLGKNGKFIGADRRTRLDLLRSLGYPEPVILDQLFSTYERQQIGERDGPKNLEEAYYFSALFLLRNPPRPMNSPARAISSPGNGAAPAR